VKQDAATREAGLETSLQRALDGIRDLKVQHEQALVAARNEIRMEFQEKHDRMKASYESKLEEFRRELEGLKATIQPRPAIPDEKPPGRVRTPPLPMPAVQSGAWSPPSVEEERVTDITNDSGLLEIPEMAAAQQDLQRETTAIKRNPLLPEQPFSKSPSTAKMSVYHATERVDVDLDVYFKPLPKSEGAGFMCVWPGCQEIVPRDMREEHLHLHEAPTEVEAAGGNGAGLHGFEELLSRSDHLRPCKPKPKKYRSGGVELYQCECGASNFDRAGWKEHQDRGHLECSFCNPPVVIQSDHLKRHLKRLHPELVGAQGKPRQS
jgi:hypothetical protein